MAGCLVSPRDEVLAPSGTSPQAVVEWSGEREMWVTVVATSRSHLPFEVGASWGVGGKEFEGRWTVAGGSQVSLLASSVRLKCHNLVAVENTVMVTLAEGQKVGPAPEYEVELTSAGMELEVPIPAWAVGVRVEPGDHRRWFTDRISLKGLDGITPRVVCHPARQPPGGLSLVGVRSVGWTSVDGARCRVVFTLGL